MTENDTPPYPPRALILADAIALTCGDREQEYGPPIESMARIAAYFTMRSGIPIRAYHAALFLECMKDARSDVNPGHRDSFVDGCAYRAIRWECAMAERGE
jgi:hypothetical protein